MGNLLKTLWEQVRGNLKWDIIKRGVEIMTPTALVVWGWIQDIPGPYLAQMFLATLAIVLFISREWRERHRAIRIPPTSDEAVPAADAWLTEIAERDLDDDIGVIIIRQRADLHTPTISAPYIEFFWTVFNGLVWEVEIEERPTGHIFLYGGPLWWHPDQKRNSPLLKPQYETISFPYSGGKRTIPHGNELHIQLLYWLSPEDVTMFKDHISSNKGLDIAFNNFNIWAVKGPEGDTRRFRLNLSMEALNISEFMEEEEKKV